MRLTQEKIRRMLYYLAHSEKSPKNTRLSGSLRKNLEDHETIRLSEKNLEITLYYPGLLEKNFESQQSIWKLEKKFESLMWALWLFLPLKKNPKNC